MATLAEVVAPLPLTEFLASLAAREIRLVRGTDPDRFRQLLTSDALIELLECGRMPTDKVRVTQNGQTVLPMFYANQKKRVRGDNLARLLSAGASIVVNNVFLANPAVGELADDARRRSTECVEIAAFVTTGPHGALDRHFDGMDLLVMQVEGRKRWRVNGPAVVNVVIRMKWPAAPPEDAIVFDEELRAGDMLLLPAGYWHVCENGPGRSFHLALGFYPLNAHRAFLALAHHLLADEDARQPMMRVGSGEDEASAAASLKAQMIERIERLSAQDLIAMNQAILNPPTY